MKYKNRKCTVNNEVFDSKKEARRYVELKALEKLGRISGLERQRKFILIPSQKDENGKTIERECSYIADFVYVENNKTVVEDAKGYANGPAREIVIANPKVVAIDNLAFSLKDEYIDMRRVVRHEIVHAFLMESGLDANANAVENWATNEEMVDWFAIQSPKIFKVYKELKLI